MTAVDVERDSPYNPAFLEIWMVEPSRPRPEQEIFDDLASVCQSPGFVHAAAAFCFRDNVWKYDKELTPHDLLKHHSGKELIRSEISTLIGLMVQRSIDYSHPGAKTLQSMMDRAEFLLGELHQAMMEPWFAAMQEVARTGNKDIDPFASAAGIREPIFYGGDSAYDFQYLDLAERKYANDKTWLEDQKGFSIEQAVLVGRYLQTRLVQKLIPVLASLRRSPPNLWTVLPGFMFSLSDVVEGTGLTPHVVTKTLEAFTDSGDEPNASFKTVSDFNTANAHPVIRVSPDVFLVLQTYSFLEAVYESPFYWMIGDPQYRNTAMESRGRFAESFSAERLASVLGIDRVTENVKIIDQGGKTRGEIDVLAFFGTRALVIQAKAKKLTIAARKGNDAAMKADFAGAVQDAYDQAKSCADLLLLSELRLVNATGTEVARPKTIEVIIPMCVVADHYPALAFQVRQFLSHEETEKRIAPLVMDTFLVDVLCEMLPSPLQLLSYLERRSSYNEKVVAGQELAILGYHLRSNLWVDGETDVVSMDDSLSTDLDIAMMARRAGVPGRRVPKGILIDQRRGSIGRIISSLEQADDPAKFDLGMMLLTLSGRTLEHLSKGIDRIARMSRTDKKVHDFTLSIAGGSTGITVHSTTEAFETAH